MTDFELKKATYYYYGLLNDKEKELYKQVLSAMNNHIERVSVGGMYTKEQVRRVVGMVEKDRPDIFWVGREYSIITQNKVIVEIKLNFLFSVTEKNNMIRDLENSRFYRELNTIISGKQTSFEKALATYEYIITHTEYEQGALTSDSDYYLYAYAIYGVMLKGRAVCAGYAKAFQYFMNKNGINCTIVSGNTKKGRHAWNLISLQGSYYYIDATWGDPIFSGGAVKAPDYICYDYFCITTADLMNSHSPVFDERMPLCTDTKCNYYRFFGLIEGVYSLENVASHIVTAKRTRKKEVIIKYSNQTAYRTAVDRLFKGSEIFKALNLANQYMGMVEQHKVRYSTDDGKRQILIEI